MGKLEKSISKTLDKIKHSGVNLFSDSARKVLVHIIAEEIRLEVEKERSSKQCKS